MFTTPRPESMLGKTVGGYHLQAHLGRGNMGTIYRGSHPTQGYAAVKILHPDLSQQPEIIERFSREFRNTVRIKHPNVVDCLAHGCTDAGAQYMVLELLHGETLGEIIAHQAPLPLVRAVEIATQVAQGLHAVHRAEVVHRDLKPDNIMEVQQGLIKLFDFGLAAAKIPDQPRLTATDLRIGTPTYMAPEYITTGALDHRSDLYALGVILFEMLTAETPFTGPPFKILHLHVTAPIPSPDTNHPIPKPLCELIQHLMQKDPTQRPQSAEEIIDALQRIG